MYKIFIIMFMFSPDPEGMDSLTVESYNDKPLRFALDPFSLKFNLILCR